LFALRCTVSHADDECSDILRRQPRRRRFPAFGVLPAKRIALPSRKRHASADQEGLGAPMFGGMAGAGAQGAARRRPAHRRGGAVRRSGKQGRRRRLAIGGRVIQRRLSHITYFLWGNH
jgi:hypothetical protein